VNSSRREIKKLLTDLLRYLFSTLLAIALIGQNRPILTERIA
jgi:hypothetical protein